MIKTNQPPKFVFNYVCFYDDLTDLWYIYHKLDKRIRKNRECYPSEPIAKADTVDEVIRLASKQGVRRWDIQVIKNES